MAVREFKLKYHRMWDKMLSNAYVAMERVLRFCCWPASIIGQFFYLLEFMSEVNAYVDKGLKFL